jgi:hypothetical protein
MSDNSDCSGSSPDTKEGLTLKPLGGGLFLVPEAYIHTFAMKGIRTVALSIGSSETCLPELDIVEDIGCPMNIVPLSLEEHAAWEEVIKMVKTKKIDTTHSSAAFLKGGDEKWIIPSHIRIQNTVPWWCNGTVLQDCSAVSVSSFVNSLCKSMKIQQENARIDILKIDSVKAAPGFERALLGAILDAGFRPAMIFVHWTESPDEGLSTAFAAGHLQNSGYRLLSTAPGNYFIYYFTDNDMYQICSWSDTTVANPMATELINTIKGSFEAKE